MGSSPQGALGGIRTPNLLIPSLFLAILSQIVCHRGGRIDWQTDLRMLAGHRPRP